MAGPRIARPAYYHLLFDASVMWGLPSLGGHLVIRPDARLFSVTVHDAKHNFL